MPPRTVRVPRIHELRLSRDMALWELAAAADISNGYLSMVERGHRGLSMAVTSRIAEALGIPPSDMMAAQTAPVSLGDILVETLTAAGMDTDTATKIQRNTSTRVQRAILRALETEAPS